MNYKIIYKEKKKYRRFILIKMKERDGGELGLKIKVLFKKLNVW